MGNSQALSKLQRRMRALCAFAPLRATLHSRSPLILCCAAAGLFVVMMAGCIGYHAGTNSLYAADVATVYVPMIESDSYRRDLGERLTEAIVKEIELKTPYKVVSTPDADSILSARLMTDTRRRIIQNGFSDPRVSETELRAEVNWINRRRQPMVPMQMIPIPAELLAISQTSNLIPEAGQSVATSQQEAIQRLAQQIVGTMEAPW
jgi:Lipopolysaccharide-assembly